MASSRFRAADWGGSMARDRRRLSSSWRRSTGWDPIELVFPFQAPAGLCSKTPPAGRLLLQPGLLVQEGRACEASLDGAWSPGTKIGLHGRTGTDLALARMVGSVVGADLREARPVGIRQHSHLGALGGPVFGRDSWRAVRPTGCYLDQKPSSAGQERSFGGPRQVGMDRHGHSQRQPAFKAKVASRALAEMSYFLCRKFTLAEVGGFQPQFVHAGDQHAQVGGRSPGTTPRSPGCRGLRRGISNGALMHVHGAEETDTAQAGQPGHRATRPLRRQRPIASSYS